MYFFQIIIIFFFFLLGYAYLTPYSDLILILTANTFLLRMNGCKVE